MHDRIGKTPARERLHDTRGHAGGGDARNIINGRKYAPDGVVASTPSTTGASHRSLRAPVCLASAPFPPRFLQPTTLVKYSGETDPAVWLNTTA